MFHYQFSSRFLSTTVCTARQNAEPTDPKKNRPSVAFNDTQFCLSKTLSHIQEMAKTSLKHDPKTPKHEKKAPGLWAMVAQLVPFHPTFSKFDPHAWKFGKISRGRPSFFLGVAMIFLKTPMICNRFSRTMSFF